MFSYCAPSTNNEIIVKGIKAQLKIHKIQPDDRKSIKGVEIIVRMLFTNTHDDAQVIYQMWEKLFAEKKNSIIQRPDVAHTKPSRTKLEFFVIMSRITIETNLAWSEQCVVLNWNSKWFRREHDGMMGRRTHEAKCQQSVSRIFMQISYALRTFIYMTMENNFAKRLTD